MIPNWVARRWNRQVEETGLQWEGGGIFCGFFWTFFARLSTGEESREAWGGHDSGCRRPDDAASRRKINKKLKEAITRSAWHAHTRTHDGPDRHKPEQRAILAWFSWTRPQGRVLSRVHPALKRCPYYADARVFLGLHIIEALSSLHLFPPLTKGWDIFLPHRTHALSRVHVALLYACETLDSRRSKNVWLHCVGLRPKRETCLFAPLCASRGNESLVLMLGRECQR